MLRVLAFGVAFGLSVLGPQAADENPKSAPSCIPADAVLHDLRQGAGVRQQLHQPSEDVSQGARVLVRSRRGLRGMKRVVMPDGLGHCKCGVDGATFAGCDAGAGDAGTG